MKKTVLVTGASKGIGKSTVLKFIKNGYNVVFTYLTDEENALKFEKELNENYDALVLAVKTDISNEEDVKKILKIVKQKFNKIDVLINNASYVQDNNYIDKTKEEFLRVLEVNVVGTFLITKYITEIMENGTVINISSLDATKTYNELSMDYCASKAGINSLTQTFSLAIPNIQFISLMLPWVNTEKVKEMYEEYLNLELKRVGQKRLLEPEEVSEKIYSIVNDSTIKSGSILSMEVEDV
jgi:3-oxoacyl-[acyl-carrier protein] reductase